MTTTAAATIDLNNNVSQCMVKITQFGYYEIHNICTDPITTTHVPWGMAGWLNMGMGVVVGTILTTMVVGLILLLVAMAREFRK
jgi:hypothetical protein